MKKHVLIGRFGAKDNEIINLNQDEHEILFPLIIGDDTLNFGIGSALSNLKKIGVFPSEIGLDLLIVAVHAYAADTRISRFNESQDSWTREIRLVVPVSNIHLWNNAKDTIIRLLNFLTGDHWSITFRTRPTRFLKLVTPRPNTLIQASFNSISLFSGGLDSLIGAIDLLESGKTPLLISHVGDGVTSKAQDACFDEIKKHYKANSFARFRFWLNIPENIFKELESEDTTRGRSFLFFTLGILAGTGINASFKLNVPENGLIALNVPLDALRLGSLSTRTTHPFYMSLWNDLLTTLKIPGKLENIYWNKTKGEMIESSKNKDLLYKTIPSSMSCSSPTKGRWKGETTQHCGYCLPCLIRRSSIKNDPTTYSLQKLDDHILDTKKSEGQQIRSFQLAINRLNKKPALSKILIYKPGPLPSDENVVLQLADVYLRGMKEVGTLLSKVITKPLS